MSFTQETLVNTNRCDGCEKHCKLYYVTVEKESGIGHDFYPTIDGKKIETYINENGRKIDAIKYNIGFNETANIEEVITKAREIARLCDHYKTR